MIIARFSDRGYILFDESNPQITVESDGTKHDFLFEYLNKDLSCLHEPLVRFMSKSMDLTTFELTGMYASLKDTDEIYSILSEIHPFFEFDRIEGNQDALIDAVGYYFSGLLITRYFNGVDKVERDEQWFKEKFEALTRCYDLEEDTYEEYFDFYGAAINAEQDEKELFKDVIKKGFGLEIYIQSHFKRMLFWVVSLSISPLNRLSKQQREWLYGNIYGRASLGSYEMSVEKRLSFNIKYRNEVEDVTQKEFDDINVVKNIMDGFYEQYDENEIVSKECEKKLEAFVEDVVPSIPSDEFLTKENEEYEVINLRQLLFLEVKKMIEQNQKIRRCRNCHRYFVVTNLNQRYCDRVSNDGFLCTEVGPSQSFQKKKDNDPALSLYLKANNAHRMRVANKIPGWNKNTLSSWRDEAKIKLDLVRSGELDLEEYGKWLKK